MILGLASVAFLCVVAYVTHRITLHTDRARRYVDDTSNRTWETSGKVSAIEERVKGLETTANWHAQQLSQIRYPDGIGFTVSSKKRRR